MMEEHFDDDCTNSWVFNYSNHGCNLDFIECLEIPSKPTIHYSDINAVWVLTAAIIVFFMKAGFMLVEVAFANGPSDRRHVIILKHQDAFASAFAFFFFGFDLVSGYTTVYPKGFPYTISEPGMWFFKFTFASNAATIVGGCLVANKYKLRIPAAFISAFVISAFIHPVVALLIWSDRPNTFSPYRYCDYSEAPSNYSWRALCEQNLTSWSMEKVYILDFAGGGAVHGIGGIVGLVLCLFAKLQEWRDKRDNIQENTHPGAEIQDTVEAEMFWKWMYPDNGGNEATVEAALGVIILWFCWFAFNCGSTENMEGVSPMDATNISRPYHRISGIVAVNMIMAGASGGVVAVAIAVWAQLRYRTESVNANEIANGILSALVSITAGCAYMDYWAAVLTGAIGVIVYHLGSLFEYRLGIKDTARVFPVHGLCGIWSMIAIGVFTYGKTEGECHLHDVYEHSCHCSLRLPTTDFQQRLLFQIFGAFLIIGISVAGSFVMFFILYIIPIKPIMYAFEKILFLNYKEQYKPLYQIYRGGLLFTTPGESSLAIHQDFESQALLHEEGQTRKETTLSLRHRRETGIREDYGSVRGHPSMISKVPVTPESTQRIEEVSGHSKV